MSFLRNRDVGQAGRPPGNGNATSFASNRHDTDTVGALVPPPVSELDTAEWLMRNELSLPAAAFSRMQEILHEKRLVTPRDRFDAFEEAFEEYHGYDYQTDLQARAGLAELEAAGNGDYAAALRTVLNARRSPGRATAPDGITDELGSYVGEGDLEGSVNIWDKHFFVSDTSGIFYAIDSAEQPDFANAALAWADRDLTNEEQDQLASLLSYSIAAVTHDRHDADAPIREAADAMSQQSYALIPAHQQDKIAELVAQYIDEGTPVRSTDRSGAGTAGTRAIEGFGIDAPQVRVLFALNQN